MLKIKKVCKLINKEICMAEEYARCALEFKGNDDALAAACYTLAGEKLKHMDALHDQITRIIAEYRKEKGEPPASMLAIYDYVHEEEIENVRGVRQLLDMYK